MAASMAPETLNLLSSLPRESHDELVDILATADGVRLERIISHGQASPDGFWYDQDEAEWVMVLAGRARLRMEDESSDRELIAGDSLYLPPHCRHRVTWTDPDRPTVWIALFIDSDRGPQSGGTVI